MSKPFLPTDRPRPDLLKDWRRDVVVRAVARLRGDSTIPDAAAHLWGHEPGAVEAVVRAASAPASSTTWGGQLAGNGLGPFLQSLRLRSAAAQLFEAARRVDLIGQNAVVLPTVPATFPEAVFVAEGAPIPVMQPNFGTVTLGPQRKLAAIVGLTRELAEYSAEDAETVIELAMQDAAAGALDAAVFSTAPASDLRPAGLLNGVLPIAGKAGGGAEAMIADVVALTGAIGDAGGGSSLLLFANPRQATALQLRAAAGFTTPVIATARLAVGTVVAVELGAIVSGFDGLPRVDVTQTPVLHFEDAAPAPVSIVGNPNAVAAPVRSGWQGDMLALRLILRCAWASRLPGGVQMVTGATW